MDILKINKRAWNVIAHNQDAPYNLNKPFVNMLSHFRKLMPSHPRVLDLGCGPGIPLTKTLVDMGCEVTAVDFSPEMISLVKKNVPEAKTRCVSVTDIAYKQEFDGVLASYSLLCLDVPSFKKAAKKISHSLKKGGVFLISLNEPPPEGCLESEYLTEIMGQKIFSKPYTENELREIYEKEGFQFLKVKRTVMQSNEYGKEYCLMALLQKKR